MALITQEQAMLALGRFMGKRVLPNGDNSDWQQYVQHAYDYAWRYFPWTYSKKTATLTFNEADPLTYLLPEDFDLEGWRQAAPISSSQKWAEVTQEDYAILGGRGQYFYLDWDFTNKRYKVNAGSSTTITITYQVKPPTLGEDAAPSLPDAQTIGLGASIWAKKGNNPTSADTQQDWDMFHVELDRFVAQAEKNRPRGFAVNLQDVTGNYTGQV